MGVCKTRNTPEHPGTPRNTPGTRLGHPLIPRNTLETARNTPRTAKIVVSGQTAHELTKPLRQKEVGHLILFTQQKSYHFYTTEVLFQTEKEVSKIKLVYTSIADHLFHSSYPYPLDQRELVDKNNNF